MCTMWAGGMVKKVRDSFRHGYRPVWCVAVGWTFALHVVAQGCGYGKQ